MKPLETLRALGTGGEAPLEAKRRVYGALMASLGTTAVPPASTQPASVGAPAPLIAGVASAKVLAIAGGIWLIGGATGAALYGALHPQEVRIVNVDHPVLSTSGMAPASASVPATATAPTAPQLTVLPTEDSGSKRSLSPQARPASELSRERALLDLARADATRGEPALVLAHTEQHRAQFPRGKLSEEREALAIRALLLLGRSNEARVRAQSFQLSYPNSFLKPAIDSAFSAP